MLLHSVLGKSIVSLSSLILDLRENSDEYLFVYLVRLQFRSFLYGLYIYTSVSVRTKCAFFHAEFCFLSPTQVATQLNRANSGLPFVWFSDVTESSRDYVTFYFIPFIILMTCE